VVITLDGKVFQSKRSIADTSSSLTRPPTLGAARCIENKISCIVRNVTANPPSNHSYTTHTKPLLDLRRLDAVRPDGSGWHGLCLGLGRHARAAGGVAKEQLVDGRFPCLQ
jgi:hypothetical protein